MSKRGAKKLRLIGGRGVNKPHPIKATLTKRVTEAGPRTGEPIRVDHKRLALHLLDGLRADVEKAPTSVTFDAVQQLIRQRSSSIRSAIDEVEGRPSVETHKDAPVTIELWSPAKDAKPEQVHVCVKMVDDRVFRLQLRTKDGTLKFAADLVSAAGVVWP